MMAIRSAVLFVAAVLSVLSNSSPPPSLSPTTIALVNKTARGLDSLLVSDLIEYKAIEQAIATFTEFLSNTTTQNVTLEMATSYHILEHAYDSLDLMSSRCTAKPSRRLTFFLLALIRDFYLVGKERAFICRMESLLAVLESCKEPTFFKLVLGVIMASIDFPAGGLCLTGAGPGLFTFVNGTDFGLNDWDLLSLFSIWAEQMSQIAPPDKAAMCEMSDRMMRNRAKWNVELKQYYCWMAKNVQCPSMIASELDLLFESAECRDFLKKTERVIDPSEL
jgi:hypothetical protein